MFVEMQMRSKMAMHAVTTPKIQQQAMEFAATLKTILVLKNMEVSSTI